MNVGYSFLLLLFGIIFGSIFYLKDRVQSIVPKVLHYIVYILLFFLGVELGSSPDFFKNIVLLGKNAIIISIISVFGSCIAAFLVKKLFFSKAISKNQE